MTSPDQFNAFLASRGEGLHPRLRDLLERTAAAPFSELERRQDGMLQAGPDPVSDAITAHANIALLTCRPARLAAGEHEQDARQLQKSVR
jgi:hypothetical protein